MASSLITLNDLPSAPPGRSGWPWTEAPLPMPLTQPGGALWPRISIVTPSFNQARFLEETIRSVLLQGYPDLEYWVMDGGSTDESAAIIERYAPWLAGWVSEPDRGQSHAINKGFSRATGEWLGWLNSDDCFAPQALYHLIHRAIEEASTFVTGASIRFFDAMPHVPRRLKPSPRAFHPAVLRYSQDFDQPTCLWQRELFAQVGPLDEDLTYTFDWQFFARCAPLMRIAVTDETIACYRIHAAHKTGSGGKRRWQEVNMVYLKELRGDDLIAFRRVLPWLGIIRLIAQANKHHHRFGLYYGWRLILNIIRRAVIERRPSLNPYILKLLELPFSTPQDTSTQMKGPVCDGTVASALQAFER